MPRKETFSLLGTDFDAAYSKYASKHPEVHNSRIRPKGVDFFEWLSASKRGSSAKSI
jgi:hypothetical protein